MAIGTMTSIQMCTYYPSSCVLKKGFSDSGFLVLCKYNNALILKSIQVFAQRIQLVLLKKTSCPANAYIYFQSKTPQLSLFHTFL